MEQLAVGIGLLGAAVALVTYGLLTSGRIGADEARYQWLNITATIGVAISLLAQWNLPAFVAQMLWIGIGVTALVRIYRKRNGVARRAAPHTDGKK